MPMGSLLPEQASCSRWPAAVFSASMALLRLEPKVDGGFLVAYPFNKLRLGSDLWSSCALVSLFLHLRGGEEDREAVAVVFARSERQKRDQASTLLEIFWSLSSAARPWANPLLILNSSKIQRMKYQTPAQGQVISLTPDFRSKCMHLRLGLLLPVSMHTSIVVSDPITVSWAGADCHGLVEKLDAAEWLLLVEFDQNLEAISNMLECSTWCMNCWINVSFYFQHMVFAAHSLECQMWNKILTNEIICGQEKSWSCHYAYRIIISGSVIEVQYNFFMLSAGTRFYLLDDYLAEDAVLLPFGLCHQRWTTTSLSMILRFNGGDPLRLSSVMLPQNLQLNPQPRVHTQDRLSGEPPAGHQPVWSTMEALKDCKCSNIESVLSTDERSLFGFISNLWYQLQVLRSSFFYFVRLGTFISYSALCRRDVLYYGL